MSIARIIVTGREGAKAIRVEEPYAVVEIDNDGVNTFAYSAAAGPLNTRLHLSFGDVENGHDAMTVEQGSWIWFYLDSLPFEDRVRTLLIHCSAGVSRSPSVAMAIADELGLGRDVIEWANGGEGGEFRDAPNQHVYRTVRAGRTNAT